MDAKRFAIGTLAGGISVLASGYAIFLIGPLRNFLVYAMTAGAATGVAREPPLLWAVALGALAYGALVTFAIGRQARPLTIGSGIRTGAVVGFLLWFTADFMFYGISNVGNLTGTIIDPLFELLPGAIAGGVIAIVLGRIQ